MFFSPGVNGRVTSPIMARERGVLSSTQGRPKWREGPLGRRASAEPGTLLGVPKTKNSIQEFILHGVHGKKMLKDSFLFFFVIFFSLASSSCLDVLPAIVSEPFPPPPSRSTWCGVVTVPWTALRTAYLNEMKPFFSLKNVCSMLPGGFWSVAIRLEDFRPYGWFTLLPALDTFGSACSGDWASYSGVVLHQLSTLGNHAKGRFTNTTISIHSATQCKKLKHWFSNR